MRSGVTVRSFPLRIHLIALALAAGLPTAILTGVLLFRSINLDRAALENRLIQVAEDLANDLDRDLDRHLTVLRTLAALPSLTAEDWPAFYAQAKGAVEGKGYVLVIDSSLRQLVNTRLPYGQAPRITGDPETARHVIETKEPAVSNLFFSLIDGIPVFNVNVPIVRDGKVRFILIYGHKADDLVPILLGQKLDPQWVTAVLDRNGTLLARSKSHAQLVGKRYALFDDELAAPDFTIRRTTSLEGDRVLRVLVRSKFSGWLVMAALPVDAAEGLLRSRLVWWGLITLVALLSSIALASWLARHMARAFAAAEAAAIALGHGQPIAVVQSSLVEANTIIAAEARAQAELEARATHHRLLMHELSHRVKNVLAVVQAMVRRTLSQQRSISDARAVLTDRLMALTRAHDALMRTDWKGAPLKEIVLAELAPFTTRVSIEGPDITIDGKVVQSFAMVVHELATNAAKHGALSELQGRVEIRWSVTGAGKEARFHFIWRERDGPRVEIPSTRGFGSALLERAFPADLEVKPILSYEPSGFVYEIDTRLDAVATEKDANPD